MFKFWRKHYLTKLFFLRFYSNMVKYGKASIGGGANSVSTTASVVALTPEEEYGGRYAASTSSSTGISKSSSMVFETKPSTSSSSSSGLVHSYSTSAIVKNPNRSTVDSDDNMVSSFASPDSSFGYTPSDGKSC